MRAKPFEIENTLSPGRPRGARNKLARRFLEDCLADWEVNGAAAIKIMRREDPVSYCKMMASIVPRELEITATSVAELADDELAKMIEQLRARLVTQEEQLALPNVKVIEHDHVQ
jgi:hypothetical protein